MAGGGCAGRRRGRGVAARGAHDGPAGCATEALALLVAREGRVRGHWWVGAAAVLRHGAQDQTRRDRAGAALLGGGRNGGTAGGRPSKGRRVVVAGGRHRSDAV